MVVVLHCERTHFSEFLGHHTQDAFVYSAVAEGTHHWGRLIPSSRGCIYRDKERVLPDKSSHYCWKEHIRISHLKEVAPVLEQQRNLGPLGVFTEQWRMRLGEDKDTA